MKNKQIKRQIKMMHIHTFLYKNRYNIAWSSAQIMYTKFLTYMSNERASIYLQELNKTKVPRKIKASTKKYLRYLLYRLLITNLTSAIPRNETRFPYGFSLKKTFISVIVVFKSRQMHISQKIQPSRI